jgi:hypothetical protein
MPRGKFELSRSDPVLSAEQHPSFADNATVTMVEVQNPIGWAKPGYGTFCP